MFSTTYSAQNLKNSRFPTRIAEVGLLQEDVFTFARLKFEADAATAAAAVGYGTTTHPRRI
jgi:hypothetical protein